MKWNRWAGIIICGLAAVLADHPLLAHGGGGGAGGHGHSNSGGGGVVSNHGQANFQSFGQPFGSSIVGGMQSPFGGGTPQHSLGRDPGLSGSSAFSPSYSTRQFDGMGGVLGMANGQQSVNVGGFRVESGGSIQNGGSQAFGHHANNTSFREVGFSGASNLSGQSQSGFHHGHWNSNLINNVVTSGGGRGSSGGGGGGGATSFGGQFGGQPFFWGSGGLNSNVWGQGSLIYGSGYLGYINPYYSGNDLTGFYNYTQPVLISNSNSQAATNNSQAATATGTNISQLLLNGAVAAFLMNDYDTALQLANRGIDEFPSEAVFHEFRALVLFAKGDYQQAAATIHAVLAVGPGWDWTTLISLYRDPNVYTTQLRGLEATVKQNPQDGAIRFLLAYHYLTQGHADAGARILKRVVLLVPNDHVAADLLKMVSGSPAPGSADLVPSPTPQAPAADPSPAPMPIEPASLVGNWSAERQDGSTFSLSLKSDNQFTWTFTRPHQLPQTYDGTYSLRGNTLTLESRGRGEFVAIVKQSDGGRLNFKVVGASDDDPGLDFRPNGRKGNSNDDPIAPAPVRGPVP